MHSSTGCSLIVFAALAWAGCAVPPAPEAMTVPLAPAMITAADGGFGMSNLFFSPPTDDDLRYPADWDDVETDALLRNDDFLPIYALRYTDAAGTQRYVVDTDADRDFGDEQPLEFRLQGPAQVADLTVVVQPQDGTPAFERAYQLLTSEDGYVYGRVAEYRRGTIALGGATYAVVVHAGSRNAPAFGLEGRTLMMIDHDGDGSFARVTRLADDGTLQASEEVELTQPFRLGEHAYRIAGLDVNGMELRLEPTDVAKAAAPGFVAPPLESVGLDGQPKTLDDYRGRVVLVEFWSVSCASCERIRPEINAMAEAHAGHDDFAFILFTREGKEEVEHALAEAPHAGTVFLRDDVAWNSFNPMSATPMFYVIDRDGTIRLRALGANALPPVQRAIEDLLATS